MPLQPIQASRIRCLATASMLPGCTEKKFIREMKARLDANGFERRGMTPGQHLYLAKIAYKFRKQLPPEVYPRSMPTSMNDERMKLEFFGPDREED